jgi:hypothetical protein
VCKRFIEGADGKIAGGAICKDDVEVGGAGRAGGGRRRRVLGDGAVQRAAWGWTRPAAWYRKGR